MYSGIFTQQLKENSFRDKVSNKPGFRVVSRVRVSGRDFESAFRVRILSRILS